MPTALVSPLPPLPPVFTAHRLREGADALARALALAPSHGAGTLTWVRAADRAEAAVVLEPEWPLAASRPALFAAASALADALGALGPPEMPVTLRWPATVLINGGVVGAARLRAPPDTPDTAIPAWLVVGIEARHAPRAAADPGHTPDTTCLFEEGFAEIEPAEIVAAWAHHLMAGLAEWQSEGLRPLAERYLARLERAPEEAAIRRALDPATGDLLLGPARRVLRDALG